MLRLTVDARDIYTRGHSDRVSYYAEHIARAMGKDEEYCSRVRMAGMFHDLGKLNVPDSVLLKDSRAHGRGIRPDKDAPGQRQL
jgi:HD-GYP domain-containing protein (c-di-GMP phosphodiesterase class II)